MIPEVSDMYVMEEEIPEISSFFLILSLYEGAKRCTI